MGGHGLFPWFCRGEGHSDVHAEGRHAGQRVQHDRPAVRVL